MPKIIAINDKSSHRHGTSYLGEVYADYDLLISKFGEPTDSFDGYKSDAEWIIEFEGGTVATIYNWKDGKNYRGEDGLSKEAIKEWHIGGVRACVVEWVKDYLFHSWPVFDDIRQEAQC